ncbi:MAG: hydroxyisourate hydrolase [Planctomycetota bacterium]
MNARSPITTHILDTAAGRPAAGVQVTLYRASATDDNAWDELATGRTDADGRVTDLVAPGTLDTGDYRLSFNVAAYFSANSRPSFYPSVTIDFTVAAADEHYHVPLLLSPYGYSTYRGS